jgi:hypothetical protein
MEAHMNTMTNDEVREWVKSRIVFERWLRDLHADRIRASSSAGDPDDGPSEDLRQRAAS